MDMALGRQDISMISGYSRLKAALLECIDDLRTINNVGDGASAELQEKIESNVFNLVVVGQFKRGKTSLINALLGADILPVAVVPLTSIVALITYGDVLKIEVFFNDGRVSKIGPENLLEYVTEKGNPKNCKDVSEVVITYPSPFLKDGVRLIDTPGVGSIYQHNTDVAYRYLPKSDAALFLLSVDQPIGKAELDFRWEMLRKIEVTIEGIQQAVENGISRRSKGENDLDKRGREIEADLQMLAKIRDRLITLKHQANRC